MSLISLSQGELNTLHQANLEGVTPNKPLAPSLIFKATYPQNFNIPPPGFHRRRIAKIILSIIILPIGIAWVAKKILCLAILRFLKRFGGIEKIILPSLNFNTQNWAYASAIEKRNALIASPNSRVTRLKLETPDGIVLDGALIWHNIEDAERYKANDDSVFLKNEWVLRCNGNAEFYERELTQSMAYCRKFKRNMLVFNYRGVLDSKQNERSYPKCAQDLTLDCHTTYQFLKKKNAKVVIEGFSLGGGIGAQAAALNPGAHIANIESFSSLPDCVKAMIYSHLLNNRDDYGAPLPNYHPSLLRRIMASFASAIAGWVVRAVLENANWEMNTAKVWKNITGQKWIVTGTHDQIMVGDGTLYKFLKHNHPSYKKVKNETDPRNSVQLALNETVKKELRGIKAVGANHGDWRTVEAAKEHEEYLKSAFAI